MFESTVRTQLRTWALQVANEHGRILKAIPLAGPDSADEPKALDLSTGGDIAITYWAPAFVISIAKPLNQQASAVLSEIQFSPRASC